MPIQRMGFEGQFFQGPAGAEATTLVEEIRDVNYAMDVDKGDTTVRGNGTVKPIETGRVTACKATIDWNMVNTAGDTILAAMLAAAYGGNPIAIRLKDHAAGKGYDGDVILTVKKGEPLRGEQTYDFVGTPTREYRTPQLYV